MRLHHGPEAAAAARSEHAHAFTAGRDIYFGQDRFNPHTNDARHLLAHEVAHVLQQTGSPGTSPHDAGDRDIGCRGKVQRAAREPGDKPAPMHDPLIGVPAHGVPAHVPPAHVPPGHDMARPVTSHHDMPETVHRATARVTRPGPSRAASPHDAAEFHAPRRRQP